MKNVANPKSQTPAFQQKKFILRLITLHHKKNVVKKFNTNESRNAKDKMENKHRTQAGKFGDLRFGV